MLNKYLPPLLLVFMLIITSAFTACGTSSESAPEPHTNNIPYKTTLTDNETRTFMSSEDGQAMEQAARSFTEAYLAGKHDEMRKYLITPEQKSNTFPSETEYQAVSSINLKTIVKDQKDEQQIVSMELASTDQDTLVYLTLQMKKQPSGWMIEYYGLEG